MTTENEANLAESPTPSALLQAAADLSESATVDQGLDAFIARASAMGVDDDGWGLGADSIAEVEERARIDREQADAEVQALREQNQRQIESLERDLADALARVDKAEARAAAMAKVPQPAPADPASSERRGLAPLIACFIGGAVVMLVVSSILSGSDDARPAAASRAEPSCYPEETQRPGPTTTPPASVTRLPRPAPASAPPTSPPIPAATVTSAPAATPDPAPAATPDPAPTATPDPAPAATPDPAPAATPDPAPTATPDPAPTGAPEEATRSAKPAVAEPETAPAEPRKRRRPPRKKKPASDAKKGGIVDPFAM